MTYNVFSGTLNPTQSINQAFKYACVGIKASLKQLFFQKRTQKVSSYPILWYVSPKKFHCEIGGLSINQSINQ